MERKDSDRPWLSPAPPRPASQTRSVGTSSARNRDPFSAPRRPAGFTLVEILMVMLIIAILGTLMVASLGTQDSRRLTAAALLITTNLHDTRSLALAEAVPTRLAIDSDPTGENYMRRFTILQWQRQVNAAGGVTGSWMQAKRWIALPKGVAIEIGKPSYLTDTAPYVADDPAVLGGDYVTDTATYETEQFALPTTEEPPPTLPYTFIEYRPSGFAAAYLAGSGGKSGQRNIHLLLSTGYYDDSGVFIPSQGDTTKNWAHLVTDSLTGRIKLYRP